MRKTCLNCGEVFTMDYQIIYHECVEDNKNTEEENQ